MAGFLLKTGKAILQSAPKVVPKAKDAITYVTPSVVRPAKDFTRGLVGKGPKYTYIAGTQGARTATVTPFYTAGTQVKYYSAMVTKKAIFAGPKATYIAGKALVRTTVTDALQFHHQPVLFIAALRGIRGSRGASTLIERGADKYIQASSRFLNRFGVAPSIGNTAGFYGRAVVIGAVVEGFQATRGRVNEIYDTAITYIESSRDRVNRATSVLTTGAPDSAIVPLGPTWVPPVDVAPPAPVATPVAPPVVPRRSADTVEYIPNPRRR